jgi:hypothetical protein
MTAANLTASLVSKLQARSFQITESFDRTEGTYIRFQTPSGKDYQIVPGYDEFRIYPTFQDGPDWKLVGSGKTGKSLRTITSFVDTRA